jgi:hypothetical protein
MFWPSDGFASPDVPLLFRAAILAAETIESEKPDELESNSDK